MSLELLREEFHARYSALGKTYLYLINEENSKSPFFQNCSYSYPYTLNKDLIQKALKIFIGRQDFSSLKVHNGDKVNPIKEIFLAELIALAPQWTAFLFFGSSFMYKMLRVFVGLLLSIGEKKLDLVKLKEIIHHQAPYTQKRIADPEGLFLFDVYYSQKEKEQFLKAIDHGLGKKLILERLFN